MHKLFVFGTLKRGFPLHERSMRGATFLGRYRTVDRMPMRVAGPWFAPMMLDRPGEGFQVRGELYEVDDERLGALDHLESVGRPGNFRKLIHVEPLGDGEACEAFVFVKALELMAPIHSGMLEDYQDRRFIPLEKR